MREGEGGAIFYVQALQASGGVPITATEATNRYTPAAPATVTLVPSGFIINGSDFSTTTQSPDTALQVCVVHLDPTTLNETGVGVGLRPGFLGTTVSLASTTPAVGTIVAPTVPFTAGDTCQSTAAFHPVRVGTTILRITGSPSGFVTPSDFQQITATVTAP